MQVKTIFFVYNFAARKKDEIFTETDKYTRNCKLWRNFSGTVNVSKNIRIYIDIRYILW